MVRSVTVSLSVLGTGSFECRPSLLVGFWSGNILFMLLSQYYTLKLNGSLLEKSVEPSSPLGPTEESPPLRFDSVGPGGSKETPGSEKESWVTRKRGLTRVQTGVRG